MKSCMYAHIIFSSAFSRDITFNDALCDTTLIIFLYIYVADYMEYVFVDVASFIWTAL